MTPLTLSPEEVEQAKTGKVTLVRPVEHRLNKSPDNYNARYTHGDDLFEFRDIQPFDIETERFVVQAPLGKVGAEFWVRGDLARGTTPDGKITRLILIHKGTRVEKRDGQWVFIGDMEVKK